MLPHLLLGRARAPAHQEGHGLDVAALAGGVRGHGGARPLRGLARRRESLLEEQADRRASVGQAEPGVEPRGLQEPVEGAAAPAEEVLDRPVVAAQGSVGGRGRQAVGVGARHRSWGGAAALLPQSLPRP